MKWLINYKLQFDVIDMNNTKLKRTVFKRFESHSEKYHKLKFKKEKLKLN